MSEIPKCGEGHVWSRGSVVTGETPCDCGKVTIDGWMDVLRERAGGKVIVRNDLDAQETDPVAMAYRRMAVLALYRPAAPSDGLGNITVPIAELDLDAEIRDYRAHWAAEERTRMYSIGIGGYSTMQALVFTIEAARSLCGVAVPQARALLQMALSELEGQE